MSAGEELLAYREELKKTEKQDLRRARIAATRFAVLAVAIQIAFVYAFFGQTHANKARILAEHAAIENRNDQKKSESQLKLCRDEFDAVSKSLEACRTK